MTWFAGATIALIHQSTQQGTFTLQGSSMKSTVVTRILISVLALCFSCCAFADTETDVVNSLRYNPKIKLVHKLAVYDGVLLGFDGGEWGGALIFLDKHGRAIKLNRDNIKGIVTTGRRVLVFSGLAHLGGNEGKIVELTYMANGQLSARELANLQGEPSAVRQVNDQTVAFQVLTGPVRGGGMVHVCKSFAHGLVSNWSGCATGSEK
jgi:hypothetical protein